MAFSTLNGGTAAPALAFGPSDKRRLAASTRVLIFFASNPEMELTTVELARKFDFPREGISTRLKPLVDAGLVGKRKDLKRESPWQVAVYSAGPALLAELGEI